MAPTTNNPTKLTKKLTAVEQVGGIFCSICHLKFSNKKTYDSHYVEHNTGDSDIAYTCVVCHKLIANYSSFRGHCYTQHLIKDKFRCQYCNKTFSKLTVLQDHIDSKHKFKCPTCKKEYQSKNDLRLHQITHNTDKPPYNCKICNSEISCHTSCEQHVDMHSDFKYTCPICHQKTMSRPLAAKHLKEHFGDVLNTEDTDSELEELEVPEDSSVDLIGILCCFCDITFKNKAGLITHFSTLHVGKEVIFSCNICGKQYEKYPLFADHCYNHLMKTKFKCDMCQKTYDRLPRLVAHREACSRGRAEAPYACTECDQRFITETGLRRHLRDTHDIHVLKCPELGCGQIFETANALIMHKRTHETIYNNWCRQCGLQFTSLASCRSHLDIHRSKSYTCPVCEKIYAEKYLMMKHIPQHFQTALHVCKACGKVYNAHNRLIEHVKTHSSGKTHACDRCDKVFTTLQSLNQHINLHMGFKPSKCVACTRQFSFHSNWSKHLLNVHNIDPKTLTKINQHDSNKLDYKTEEPNYKTDIDDLIEVNGNNFMHASMEYVSENFSQANVDNSNRVDVNLDNHNRFEIAPEAVFSDDFNELDNIEASINSMCSELMTKDNTIFGDCIQNDSIELDSINPSITEKETNIFHNDNGYSYVEFSNVLPESTFGFVSDASPQTVTPARTVPPEYGPDFVSPGGGGGGGGGGGQLIALDDAPLPHIDPRLTLLEEPPAGAGGCAWAPPLLAKLDQALHAYSGDVAGDRYTYMNTDIY